MTKTSRRTGPHRPTLGQIARILPEAGSREARLLIHVLKCDICTDAALSILEIGNRSPKGRAPNYDAVFEAAVDRAIRLFEQRLHAMALAERLFEISDPEALEQAERQFAEAPESSPSLTPPVPFVAAGRSEEEENEN